MTADIPEGFAPFAFPYGFLETNGPIYGKWDGPRFLMGFRVEDRHCNPMRICHGGWLASFADMFLPVTAYFQSKLEMAFMPTVNLTCDFLAPAPLGAWVEARGDAARTTKNLLFAHGVATVDGQPVLRANGIFKVVKSTASPNGDFPVPLSFEPKG